ncbi:MAG: hypothetical protein ACYTE5_00190 [Planctomycetota bacterium]|jgi:hypothetical protein
MADADSRTFEVGGKKYKVVKPTLEVLNEATKLRSRTFNEALQAGDMLREQLEDQLKKRNLWNDDLEIEYQTLRKEVVRLTTILTKGGINLNQARDIALDVANKRARMVDMLSSRSALDSNSCEGKADAARFNYLFANCLVYNDTDEKYFPNGLVDYLLNQEDPVAAAGATEFYYLISNSEDPTDDLVENKFLKQYKFVDEDYRLIDKEGRLIDNEGRHIDEEGYYIEWLEDGTSRRVDVNGNIINSDGTPELEFTPFLDDDGNPVVLSDDKPKKKTPRKRSPRKKKTETADS